MNVAKRIVQILEERGVNYVFGLPGEENIALVNALDKSEKIKFVLVLDERAGGFMASVMGWLGDQPGVVLATLGPGALNLTLSIADAHSHSFPVIAISAQGDIRDRVRETTQMEDLKRVFQPITKWSEDLIVAESTTELINKAYNQSMSERKGASFVTIPASLEQAELEETNSVVIPSPNPVSVPIDSEMKEAVNDLKNAKKPVLLAGLGVSRENLSKEITQFSQSHHIPVMTSFMAKGALSDHSKLSLGTVGFFIEDYIDDYLEDVDLILAVGYDFSEFEPSAINPNKDKKIINLHTFPQETHEHYPMASQLVGNLRETLDKLSNDLGDYVFETHTNPVSEGLLEEFNEGEKDGEVPLSPNQIVHATRQALPEEGKVLVDTGAVKMWMARLFPTFELNSVLINNGLSSMSWALPGTIAAKLLFPEIPMLTVMGDGSFLMTLQEIATAVKYDIPLTILIWDDSGYGLIKWKMAMDLGQHANVDFDNPDFIKIAESFGGNGYVVDSREDLEQKLSECLKKDEGINLIIAPVDYSENMDLTNNLKK